VVGGDGGLEGGVDEDLRGFGGVAGGDFEDGAGAVADVEVAFGVEDAAGGGSEAFGVGGGFAAGVDAVDGSVGARGDVEVAGRVEGEACGVENAGDEGGADAVGADADDGDGGLFAAGPGDGGEDHAGAGDNGAGDGMESVREEAGDAELCCVAGAFGSTDFGEAFGGVGGDAEFEAGGAAHEQMSAESVDVDGGQGETVRAEMAAEELDFTVGKRGLGR